MHRQDHPHLIIDLGPTAGRALARLRRLARRMERARAEWRRMRDLGHLDPHLLADIGQVFATRPLVPPLTVWRSFMAA